MDVLGLTLNPENNASAASGKLNFSKETLSLIGGIAGIGYAFGFLVVNSWLMRWGIIDLSLLKLHYIAVGVLYVAHFALVAAFGFAVPKPQKYFETAIRLVACFAAALAVSLIWSFITSTVLWEGEYRTFWSNLTFADYLKWVCPVYFAGILIAFSIQNFALNLRWLRVPMRQWLLIVAVLCSILAIRAYATEVYPFAVAGIGGGDFYLVRIIPKQGVSLRGLETGSEVRFGPTTTPSDPLEVTRWVWLLDQSEKAYFVLVCNRNLNTDDLVAADLDAFRAVEIQKELVAFVIHFNRSLDTPALKKELPPNK
jgi:hypothetical protein